MIIRRDCMLHTPPSAQMIAAAAARGFSSPSTSSSTTPASNNSSPISVNPSGNSWMSSSPSPALTGPYTLNPLQQREAMQREAWEKERNSLLKKASNSQGDSMERLVRAYLAV
jgi:hypothetical protein